MEARPGARLKLDLEGPRAPFGARVAPARVWSERVAVTYMEDAQTLVRRAELATVEAAVAATPGGVLAVGDERVPLMWREDPGYRVLGQGGAQAARLVGVGALVGRRGVDKVYHVLERPAGLTSGLTLAVLVDRGRQPLMRAAAPLALEGELEAVLRASGEALREGGQELAADGVEVEAVGARIGAGWHTVALAQAVNRGDQTEATVAILALDASLRQRRVLFGPALMRGWERWSLVAVTDVDGDGFAEVLVQRGGAGASQLVLVHTRIKPAADAAPSPYNLCPELDAGPDHIFFCLSLGAAPAPEPGDGADGAPR